MFGYDRVKKKKSKKKKMRKRKTVEFLYSISNRQPNVSSIEADQ